MPRIHLIQDTGESPAGGATVRRWTLRENRSCYETEAHAFRRWVLSQPISGDWKKATQERLSASRSQKNAEASKKENGNTNDEPILVEPPHIENLPAVVKDFRTDGLRIDEIAVRVGITRLQVFEILNANA